MKRIMMMVLAASLTGCATVNGLASSAKPKYTPDPQGVHMVPTGDDLRHEFVNLSGRADFDSKMRNLSYEYMGWIHYDVPYTESTLADVKKTARDAGGDGLIIWMTGYSRDPLLGREYGISALVIRLK